jgi:hypothetical protein
MENNMMVPSSKKLKVEQPYDSEIPVLGIYPKEMSSVCQRDISTPMFIIASLTIAKIWKPLKCPSNNKKIKKMW